MSSLLLKGGVVVPVDGDRSVFDPGYVLVEDGAITGVGAGSPEREADRTLDVSGCVVVPGFVNTHQHHWYNLFKGLGEGMLLERWISDLLVPAGRALSEADLEVASSLSCLEMMRSGTTTSVNHMVSSTFEPHVDAILGAVDRMGMRQVFGKEVRAWDLEEQLDLAEAIHSRWNGKGGGRIRIGFAIESSAHWVAMKTSAAELIQRGDELAARLGTVITDHVAGGTMSREEGDLKYAYSNAVVSGGLIFLAGQCGIDENYAVVSLEFEPQARQALARIQAGIEAAGGALSDITTMTIFITDVRYGRAFTSIRKEVFGDEFPASTLVTVSQLMPEGALVEVQAIGVLPDAD